MEKTYLMWVGSDSYKTIDEWVEEALALGVSKRLPNVNVGASLKDSGTVVFVAHDEGEWRNCLDCMGTIENPVWRKTEEKMARYAAEIANLEKERDALTDTLAIEPGYEEEAKRKRCDSLNRKIAKRETKMSELEEETKEVKELIEGGTGGLVKVTRVDTAQKETIDYRKYDYWHHQPKKFLERYSLVGEPNMCKECGGKGKLPEAKVFGLFVPSAVEYILKAEDSNVVEEEMSKRGFRTVSAKKVKARTKRNCGVQKEGGVYVVTDKDAGEERAKGVVDKLVSRGVVNPDGVEVKGNFVRFLAPVQANVKRFRGIKKWEVEEGGDVEEETEMIMDALE